jgi:hypothetical protein
MKDGGESLGEVAWDVLQRIVRERLARKSGGHLVEPELDRLDLHLPLSLGGAEDEPRRFAAELVRSIDRLLDDAVQHAAAFRPGHAWCHRCERADCEHSRPPGCRHVFVGYAPTGTPRWEDFAQVALDLGHPEVDRLYDPAPAFLTLVQGKEQLHQGMLQAFRDGSYELLGQVTAGFYTVPTRLEEGRGVLALSFQAAASRPSRGRRRIGLNLIGLTPAGESLDLLWDRQDELPWRRAVRWAQTALGTLNRSRRGGGSPRGAEAGEERIQSRVEGILRGLARRLERDRRARGRRTRHAEQRHSSGERPTRKALDDAREANPESVMVDESRGTLVVLGERGRTHFFTPDGKLVSSVRYGKDAIARKIKHDRWRPATAEEARVLRSRLGDPSPGVNDPAS